MAPYNNFATQGTYPVNFLACLHFRSFLHHQFPLSTISLPSVNKDYYLSLKKILSRSHFFSAYCSFHPSSSNAFYILPYFQFSLLPILESNLIELSPTLQKLLLLKLPMAKSNDSFHDLSVVFDPSLLLFFFYSLTSRTLHYLDLLPSSLFTSASSWTYLVLMEFSRALHTYFLMISFSPMDLISIYV